MALLGVVLRVSVILWVVTVLEKTFSQILGEPFEGKSYIYYRPVSTIFFNISYVFTWLNKTIDTRNALP